MQDRLLCVRKQLLDTVEYTNLERLLCPKQTITLCISLQSTTEGTLTDN